MVEDLEPVAQDSEPVAQDLEPAVEDLEQAVVLCLVGDEQQSADDDLDLSSRIPF